MRVGLDASFLAHDAIHTGMGVYARGLAQGLATVGGAEVILLGYGDRAAGAPDGLEWYRLPQLRAGRLSPWLSHQLVLPLIARRLHLDVLHVTGVNVRLSRPGVPFFSPCPLVVTMHDAIPLLYYGHVGPPLPPRLRLSYQLALLGVRRAAAVITVSETSRRDILSCVSLDSQRVRVIYNGLDFFTPTDSRETTELLRGIGIQTPYLLYAGSFEPRKNLLGAVAAYAAALRHTPLAPLVLLVERQSGYRAEVMAEVKRSGLRDRLIFLHSLDDEHLAALYARAELLIYPSLYEGFGFVPLQAMACGVPVVSSACGALPEVLGDAAAYVDASQPEAIGRLIVDLLQSPLRRAELRVRGTARAARYRWDSTAAATLEAYKAVISSQSMSATADSSLQPEPCGAPRSR
jgi:glycosyltransferase involved in cell wall biosynthesis